MIKARDFGILQLLIFLFVVVIWLNLQTVEDSSCGESAEIPHIERIAYSAPLHGAANGDEDYSEPELAGGKVQTKVVMFVPSPVPWEARRQHVHAQFEREGWNKSQAVLLFVFGNRSGDNLQDTLNISVVEYPQAVNVVVNCRDYGDEWNSADDSSGTTCKVYKSLKYIVANYVAQYVWRGADDSYVNLKYFFTFALPATRLYFGDLRTMNHLQPDLMLATQPELAGLYGLRQFGQYMYGSGYVLSFDVADFVASLKIPPHLTWCEDVMIGMWLNPFQIEFRHSPLWTDRQYASLGVDYILIHRMLPEHWARLDGQGRLH